MTAVSEPRRPSSPVIAANSAKSRDGSRVVHRVHDARTHVCSLGLSLLLFAGCVLPPTLSVDVTDAGMNSPPAITAVRADDQELPEPGPVNFETGINAGMMSVSLVDTDVTDTLYVSLFVDYFVSDPTPPRATCTAAPTGTPARSATCDLTALCTDFDVQHPGRFLTVQVFDRKLAEAGAPRFKLMESDDGMTTSRGYLLNCQGPS